MMEGTVPVPADGVLPLAPAVQRSPLGNANLGTRRANHVLLSEIDEAPWLLPRPEERSFKFEKPAAIRAAITAIEKHGVLIAPALIGLETVSACRADGEAAFAAALSCSRTCESPLREPLFRYSSKLDMTRAARAAVLAIRASQPLSSAIAARLGDDAALCELSCVMTDPGAGWQPPYCETPARQEDTRTAYQRTLAQHGKSVMTVLIALGSIEYGSGARLLWPGSHTAAFHERMSVDGAAEVLRLSMGVHMDLRAGDAMLTDSRLWQSGGAHAAVVNGEQGQGAREIARDPQPPPERRSMLLVASFTSPSFFPDGSQYAMRTRLVGRFSLLNIEALLGRGGYSSVATSDDASDVHSEESQRASRRGYTPRPVASLLLVLVSTALPAAEPRAQRCRELLHAALDASAPPTALPPAPTDASASPTAPPAAGLAAVALAPPDAATAAARMVRLPAGLLHTIRTLVPRAVRAEPRWQGLWRHVEQVLRADAKAADARGLTPQGYRLLSRDELRARWLEAHSGYQLSRVSELRPPVDALAFSRLLADAAKGRREAIVSWLEGGGSINAQGGAGASTLLQRASAGGDLALVQLLTQRGAKVNLQDDEGSTALHAAAHMGHLGIVQHLLKCHAAIDVCDADGETAAEWAAERGHDEIAALLTEQKFEPIVLCRLLSDEQVASLVALRETVQQTVHDDGAGHEVIFLHASQAAGLLSSQFDEVVATLVQTMKDHDPRSNKVDLELSVRCVELHKYTVGASLMDRDHKDSGSSLTLSVALSDRQSFEGGEFLTWRGDERVAHRLSCGDGILFRSEDLHNVAPVRQGVRQSLVIELWVGTTNLIDRSR